MNVLRPGGAALTVTAGTSDLKSKRPSAFKQVTSRDAIELQNELSTPNIDVTKILHWIRNKLGRKAVAARAGSDATERQTT